ncbi:hypothetical protein G6L37_01575 [Agrobacterium rubi]|nr:hypothetical protein [Agrobacterium rubi]NTF24083.1 hypothetical protein [Agrobacterium rubi]
MQQNAGQAVHGSRGAKLRAAHVEAGKFIARMALADPKATSFRIDTGRGLTFSDGGVESPLSLFHIVGFAEGLKRTNAADKFDISGGSVTIHLNESGLKSLRNFAHAKRVEVPRKEAKAEMHTRLLRDFRLLEKELAARKPVALVKPVEKPARVETVPSAAGLLAPILRTLSHGSRSAEDIARLVSIRMKVSMDRRNQPYLENGVTFDDAVTHAVNYLIGRRLLAHPSRQIGLTAAGREQADAAEKFVAEGFLEPDAPARARAKEKLPKVIKVMTHADLLAFREALPGKSVREILNIWDNAVKTTSDPSKASMHEQAEFILRAVSAEWAERSSRSEIAESFRWPDANSRGRPGTEEGKGRHFEAMVENGMLSEVGYSVGRNSSLSSAVRQRILTEIFVRSLPPVFPAPYMQQWGENGSARRLHKIADCLAAFARNAARLPGNYDEAIADWKEDLEYLHDRHYAGRFGFGWPQKIDAAASRCGR